MEMSQVIHITAVILSFLLVASVCCEEEQHADQIQEGAASQPQKRSIAELEPHQASLAEEYIPEDEDFDKRGTLFRFGKRGSLFRFGKRGSLLRFGKRGSLFRFGKRGTLFRFGKRDDDTDQDSDVYPYAYLDEDDVKRAVKSFHWGRETEE